MGGGYSTFLIFGRFGEICQCLEKKKNPLRRAGWMCLERQFAALLKAGDYISFKDFHCIKAISEFSEKQQPCTERHAEHGPSFEAETK